MRVWSLQQLGSYDSKRKYPPSSPCLNHPILQLAWEANYSVVLYIGDWLIVYTTTAVWPFQP